MLVINDATEEEHSENYYKVAAEVAQAGDQTSQNESSFESFGDNDFDGFN